MDKVKSFLVDLAVGVAVFSAAFTVGFLWCNAIWHFIAWEPWNSFPWAWVRWGVASGTAVGIYYAMTVDD